MINQRNRAQALAMVAFSAVTVFAACVFAPLAASADGDTTNGLPSMLSDPEPAASSSTSTTTPTPNPSSPSAPGNSSTLRPDVPLKGSVQQNRLLSVLNARLGFITKANKTEDLPAKITGVTPSSPAAKRGVVAGNTLTDEVCNSDGSVTVSVDQGKNGMRFTISASELAAAAQSATLAAGVNTNALKGSAAGTGLAAGAGSNVLSVGVNKNQSPMLQAGANTRKLNGGIAGSTRKLSSIVDVMVNHDLGLIIDRSSSMHGRDCPNGLSRWDWCCSEATQLAEAAAEASSSVDASIFNTQYVTYRRINPRQIPEIFAENGPSGGTEPAYALQEQMENYFNSSRAKPLTICIVTDGLPNRPQNIAGILQEESKKIRYQGELTVTFLLIGNQVDEVSLKQRIGINTNSSISNGGFVDVVPFAELEAKGIKQSLFDHLKQERQSTDPSKPSHASESAVGAQYGQYGQAAPYMQPPPPSGPTIRNYPYH